MRVSLVPSLLLALSLGACESDLVDPSANPDAAAPGLAGAQPFADSAPGAGEPLPRPSGSLISLGARLVGASVDGGEADVVLSYRLDAAVRERLGRESRLSVRLITPEGGESRLAATRIDADSLRGEVAFGVPVGDGASLLTATLERIGRDPDDPRALHATIALPAVLGREDTDLDALSSLGVTLVPGSYASALEGGRRVHRFSVRVDGTVGEGTEPVSVTGLERATGRYFHALEYGVEDVESPVRVAWDQERMTVHLVMDVSGSVVTGAAADDLLDAVARTVVALGDVADFELRTFAADTRRIESLRELAFDEAGDSGTALYHAIDLALEDIERFGSPTRDKVLVAFTDGRDFASRNFHPEFVSHEQVREHLGRRLATVRRTQRERFGRRLDSWFVGLGGDVDAAALGALAEAGGGEYLETLSSEGIEEAFAHLTGRIRGVYRLEYSSQQTPDDTDLALEVRIGEHVARVRLPTLFQP